MGEESGAAPEVSGESSISLVLPPFGLFFEDLAAVLREVPLEGFLDSAPTPFLVDLPEGIDAMPAFAADAVGERLRVWQQSPELDDVRVYSIAPPTPDDPIDVGRADGGVQLDEPSVDERHAELRQVDGAWTLLDLGSAGGTWVEGNQLAEGAPLTLESGQQLELGEYRCLFLEPAHLHQLATGAAPETPEGPRALTPTPEGRRFRVVAEELLEIPEEELLASPVRFLLEVPMRSAVPLTVAEDPAAMVAALQGRRPTAPFARSKILAMQRDKQARKTRMFVVSPSHEGAVVGRSAECQVVIDEPSASKEHAKLVGEDGRWQVVDLESNNGTFVYDEQVPPGVGFDLEGGEMLAFGAFHALFLTPERVLQLAKPVVTGKRNTRRLVRPLVAGKATPKQAEEASQAWEEMKSLDLSARPEGAAVAKKTTERFAEAEDLVEGMRRNPKRVLGIVASIATAIVLAALAIMKIIDLLETFAE